MKKLLITLFSCILFIQGNFAQTSLQAPLPMDPNVIIGQIYCPHFMGRAARFGCYQAWGSTLVAEVLSRMEMTVAHVVSSLHHIRKGCPP